VRVVDGRAICDICGHTREWHDLDAARLRLHADPPIERPCYREIGGTPCRCGGFRESGEAAMPVGSRESGRPRTQLGLMKNSLLTLLLVVMGLALLYAYRSQSPAVPMVPVSAAIADIERGQIRSVTIAGGRTTLEFRDSPVHREETFISVPDTIVSRAVADYNAAHPSDAIVLRFEPEPQTLGVVGSIVLSVLPVLLIGGFFYYVVQRTRRAP
jgi:hypothetical protein